MMTMRGTTIMALGLALITAAPAVAQPDPAEATFARLTRAMPAPRRAQFCAYVATQGLDLVVETPDPQRRRALLADAFSLRDRLRPVLAKARPPAADDQENGQIMGLLSYAPSTRIKAAIDRGEAEPDDVGTLFVADVISRCNAMLDAMKVAPAPALPPLPIPVFRWAGLAAADSFAGTPLAPVAARLCMGNPPGDLAGMSFSARGKNGESLLDWAMQCRDRAAFTALLAAGHDPDAPGAGDEPPLVRAAGLRDTSYLAALLAKGAKPDAIGRGGTALEAAYQWSKPDGGERFVMLRAAGASLHFPDASKSLWTSWFSSGSWQRLLDNWAEFKGDPVYLAWLMRTRLKNEAMSKDAGMAEVKRRLETEHGVCFPVTDLLALKQDARGFYIQPACAPPAAPARP